MAATDLDHDAVAGLLARGGIDVAPADLRSDLVQGGRSNLTYAVTDGSTRWVLRRPPLGHVLATAHDMAREHRVMDALRDSAVPVPRMVVLDAEGEVLGVPAYVMEHVDGRVLRQTADTEPIPEQDKADLALRLVDVLADLHAVDPDAVGLGDLGRPSGYLERQVRRWGEQLDRSRSRDLPDADALHADLGASVPDQAGEAVVHGDFRLDNAVVGEDLAVRAVLDWEMATLGDPLADLGLMLVYWDELSALPNPVLSGVGAEAGFPSGDALAAHYAARTGHDVDRLDWYVALGCFKLAVVLEGIHYRHLQGQTAGDGFDRIGAVVEPLLAAGRRRLGR